MDVLIDILPRCTEKDTLNVMSLSKNALNEFKIDDVRSD